MPRLPFLMSRLSRPKFQGAATENLFAVRDEEAENRGVEGMVLSPGMEKVLKEQGDVTMVVNCRPKSAALLSTVLENKPDFPVEEVLTDRECVERHMYGVERQGKTAIYLAKPTTS